MSEKGRRVSKRKSDAENDAVISLFPDNDTILTWSEIHIGLCEKNITNKSNKSKTSKILQRLVRENLVEKLDSGRYRAKVKPDEFKLFDYLTNLRDTVQKDNLYSEGSVGGALWKMNDLYFIGLPEEYEKDPIAKYVIEILSIRLANMYLGLKELSHYLLRKRKYPDTEIELPSEVIRELFLEIMPYYLGSKAGIDGDGLEISDLRDLIGELITAIPEVVESEGWGSSTSKDFMQKSFEISSTLLEQSKDNYFESSDYIVEQTYSESPEFPKGRFAIVLTDPVYLIDEDAHQRRTIFRKIIELNDLGDSAIDIVGSLLLYDESNVLDVLEKFAHNEVGRKKSNELIKLYKKMAASRSLAYLLGAFEEGYADRGEIKNLIENYHSDGVTTHDLVYYLSFCVCHLNFISPTERKTKLIYAAFPTVPHDKIDEWYQAGIREAKHIANKTIKRLKETWSNRN